MSVAVLDDKEILYRFSKLRELPPLPTSLKRLIEIIHFQVDEAGELESIIAYDPCLSAKILAVSNSTYFGQRNHVRTIANAITIMGVAQVKSICIYTLLLGLFSSGSIMSAVHRERLWKHAFACSRIIVEINKKRPWINGDQAGLMGLFHDMGWIVMAAYLSEHFFEITKIAGRENIPPWCVEVRYGLDHGKLGGYLARKWALPEEYRAVMEFHHAPRSSVSFKPEVGLVYLANVLSHSLQYPELANAESTLLQCRNLCISENEWNEYLERAEEIRPEVERLWNLLGAGQL
jgi:HD-like signal output (HDOD) protein